MFPGWKTGRQRGHLRPTAAGTDLAGATLGRRGQKVTNAEATLSGSTHTETKDGQSVARKSGRRLRGDTGQSGAHALLFLRQGADHVAVVTLWD